MGRMPARETTTKEREPLLECSSPVSVLPGIGPARARALAGIGVRTLRDLLFLLPRRAAAEADELPIASALGRQGSEVGVRGRVTRVSLQRFGGRSTLRVTLADASGEVTALFFNQPWLRHQFAVGAELALRGRLGHSRGPVLLSPRFGKPDRPLAPSGSITLVYPSVDGLSAERIGALVRELSARLCASVEEHVPAEQLAARDLPPLHDAVRIAHAPESLELFARARRRLALEALLRLQGRLHARRQERRQGRSLRVALTEDEERELRACFPFTFTAGQDAIASALRGDLARGVPMRRLLQGDVGSGKTALGVYACLAVARAGGQAAFVAPTELLAEQHFEGLRERLKASRVHAVLLTGSIPAAERRSVLAQLESGMADVAFGTHALFGEDVRFAQLSLAVIDEQQRFGVAQRARLIEKGSDVHVLLMTATPIPRTLALSLYGDLDTSVLRERPPGRGTVRTRWVRAGDRQRVPAFLRERLGAGERVYWVAPRIGASVESDEHESADERPSTSGEASAERAFAKLTRSDLAAFGIELVHGRLPPDERSARLARFRSGAARLLVATTVIEVGVDVPEATVLVVENAERLGLAQLHQLRGRIGRGGRDGWCLLFAKAAAAERMQCLERVSDGFEIAEEDLRRRGMGDLAGLRQAGENLEGLDDGDLELLVLARDLISADARLAAAYAPVEAVPLTP